MKNYGDYTKLAIDINIFSFKNKIISINSSIYIFIITVNIHYLTMESVRVYTGLNTKCGMNEM